MASSYAREVRKAILDSSYGKYRLQEEVLYKSILEAFRGMERADFYIDALRLFIEVDGEQHFKPVAFSGNKEEAKENYKSQRRRDKWIQETIKDRGYYLLSLSYKEIQESENLPSLLEERITSVLLED